MLSWAVDSRSLNPEFDPISAIVDDTREFGWYKRSCMIQENLLKLSMPQGV